MTEPVPTRQEMAGIKVWPTIASAAAHGEYLVPTLEELRALGDVRYPDAHPKRRMSPAGRDLLALGRAALEAGYEPGDRIPPNKTRGRKR